jgi:site-specific recombinase XerD
VSTLQVMAVGPIIREAYGDAAVKDKTYQRSPLGQDVRRYLRALRWEGKPSTTLDSYESVLAKLAIEHDDFEGIAAFCTPVGTEYLREFLERRWSDAAAATRGHHASVLRAFFKWGVEEKLIAWSPAEPIKGPRIKTRERNPHDRATMFKLLGRQESLRDTVALKLLCKLALRKNELRLAQVRDFDLTRNLVLVHGKGGKEVLLPIVYEDLREDLYLHFQGEGRRPGEYLLYPKSKRHTPMQSSSVHRWFKRCLERAELPDSIEIHELRHFAGDELWRETGNLVLAQRLLRHESVGTTQAYLHPTRDDLAAAMRQVESAWRGV